MGRYTDKKVNNTPKAKKLKKANLGRLPLKTKKRFDKEIRSIL